MSGASFSFSLLPEEAALLRNVEIVGDEWVRRLLRELQQQVAEGGDVVVLNDEQFGALLRLMSKTIGVVARKVFKRSLLLLVLREAEE